MASKRHLRRITKAYLPPKERHCERKKFYKDVIDAEQAVVRTNANVKEPDAWVESYKCAYCTGFHVGHVRAI